MPMGAWFSLTHRAMTLWQLQKPTLLHMQEFNPLPPGDPQEDKALSHTPAWPSYLHGKLPLTYMKGLNSLPPKD